MSEGTKNNLRYTNAPTYKYFDEDGWKDQAAGEHQHREGNDTSGLNGEWNCEDDYDYTGWRNVQHPGYIRTYISSYGSGGINCGAAPDDGGIMEYKKNPDDPFWNVNLTEYNKVNAPGSTSTQIQKDIVLKKVYNCCADSELTSLELKNNCGDLYKGGSTGYCGAITEQYCKTGDNITKPTCKPFISVFDSLKNHLKDVCPGKEKNVNYNDVCPCYYSDAFYEELAENIKKEWLGPGHLLNIKPECLHPRCHASPYADTKVECGNANFASCSQKSNVDVSDNSSVKNIEIKPACQIIFNNNNSSSGTGGGTSDSTVINKNEEGGSNKNNGDPPGPPESSFFTEHKYLLLFLLCVVIAGYLYKNKGGRNDEEETYYQNDYPPFQEETYPVPFNNYPPPEDNYYNQPYNSLASY
jgi:hypothetical protein